MQSLISIVIPTYKRKENLIKLLESLGKVVYPKFEVLVVEQGETNKASFEKQVKEAGMKLRYFLLKKRSTAKAMNTGVAKAKGDYVLFLDDDVTVDSNIIEAHVKNFVYPKVGATVGRIITNGQKIEPERIDTGKITWLGSFTDGFSSTVRQEVDTVIGCNTCWRKDVYVQLGGMDERFTGNALRLESDLSLRAKNAGYTIIFEPRAVVHHHRAEIGGARKSEGRIEWYKDFFSNETYFFLKHRPKVLLPLFLCTKTLWVLRCMFGFGREVSVRSMVTPAAGVIEGIKKYGHRR